MEVSDSYLWNNRDWDLSYLSQIVTQDFFEFNELWSNSTTLNDVQLVEEVHKVEKYCPIVEDISLDDQLTFGLS